MHRSCPQCAWSPREQWLSRWKQRLLPTGHHHVVFTVPHSLIDLWRFNRKTFADTLFQAASQTLLELLADPKYLGARPGILAALHTWNQKLEPHIHLHVLITAGGLKDSQWLHPVKACLLPRRVLMLKFRGKFKALLRRKVEQGAIVLPGTMDRAGFDRFLSGLNRTPWNVKIHDLYDHGQGVTTYLARYIKGGPMSNSRLLDVVGRNVRFRYRLSKFEGGDGQRTGELEMPVSGFIGLWLAHVPPHRFQVVRGYGLYSGNQHSQLSAARTALGTVHDSRSEEPAKSWQERCEQAGLTEVCRCPKCGSRLITHHPFKSGHDPPLQAFRFRVHRGKQHEAA
jgi:hypothetical protein